MKQPVAVFALVLVVAGSQASSTWPNPAERYSKAYEAYLDSTCPIEPDSIKHFVYLSRDRQRLRDHAFLRNPRFAGAQIMYAWRELEPAKDRYDFSMIEADLDYLTSRNRQLFIQLQDATFNPKFNAVPDYLLTPEYDGGAILQRGDNNDDGWTAKRWNEAVRQRFAALLKALGERFDGSVAGINLQETAIGVTSALDPSFTPENYVIAIEQDMLALKQAFPRSTKLQYANFMPGEWLPWDDKGYLRAVYSFAEKAGVGLGAPDLMVRKKGQLNHVLALMHEHEYSVPLGIAVQDGNYVGATNSDRVVSHRQNLVPMLHRFAAEFLRVDYMFWVDQAPYFEEDVLPCFSQHKE